MGCIGGVFRLFSMGLNFHDSKNQRVGSKPTLKFWLWGDRKGDRFLLYFSSIRSISKYPSFKRLSNYSNE
ncbi:hypothetical protein FDUTEX481_09744 [Tolypothrix sp. PCC 7601]|nr:hypothetical protein FDUTEX481_09744 [Tolypothrix sp. PCC 7601]